MAYECSTQLSGELRDLFRRARLTVAETEGGEPSPHPASGPSPAAERTGAPPTSPPVALPVKPDPAAPGVQAETEAALSGQTTGAADIPVETGPRDMPCRPIRLRRDGYRPDVFLGALVLGGHVCRLGDRVGLRLGRGRVAEPGPGEIVQATDIFLRPDGSAVLSLRLQPGEAVPLHPVHSVIPFSGADELAAALRRHDPGAAVPVPTTRGLWDLESHHLAQVLREDFLRLLAGLGLRPTLHRPTLERTLP